MSAVFIGLMSGTSLDGVDGVVARWVDDGPPQVLGFVHHDFAPELRAQVLALQSSAEGELHRAALASNALALGYAAVVDELLAASRLSADQIMAIGAHGQTVRHRPGEFDGLGYTCQLLNGALLAERCGIDVVCDLRSRDVAAGGQGAPLVPAFHAGCFGSPHDETAVLNIGGIANLSLLPLAGPVSGFDTGPGNMLMDAWCQRQRGSAFDADGAWASSGRVLPELLRRLLAEPYFDRLPPKSTGRDLFDLDWLAARLAGNEAAADVMATLAELTAQTAIEALARHAPATRRLLVCGGGAFNGHLLARLTALAPGVRVDTTAKAGVPPDQVEALAFAWLARRFVARLAGNLPAVTGAAGPRVLGALYPA